MRMGLRDLRSGENMSAKERVRASRANGITGRGQQQEVMSNDLSQYVTTKQAAEMLGLATTSINHLLAAGRIKGKKLGTIWLVYTPSSPGTTSETRLCSHRMVTEF